MSKLFFQNARIVDGVEAVGHHPAAVVTEAQITAANAGTVAELLASKMISEYSEESLVVQGVATDAMVMAALTGDVPDPEADAPTRKKA